MASESSGDAKEMVKQKNSLQEAEKKQSETEEGNEEKADSEKEQSKDEDEEGKAREDEESTLKIQGFEENAHQIQAWLEDLLERPLNLNNPKDKAIYEFWCGLLEQGYTLDQVHSLIDTVALAKKTIDFWYNGSFYQMGKVDLNDVKAHRALFNWASLILQGFSPQDVRLLIILTKTFRSEIKNNMLHRDLDVTKIKDVKIIAGWSLYRRQGYSASGVYTLFKNRLLPEIEKLIPNFNLSNPAHAGFFTYWCEKALVRLSGGLDYVSNFLNAMAQIKGEVEALIGEVDFLDNNYQDNGFITYWAEQALKKGVNYIKRHLYIWKRLFPAIEQKLERELDLFNPEDTGTIDFWANKVAELMEEAKAIGPKTIAIAAANELEILLAAIINLKTYKVIAHLIRRNRIIKCQDEIESGKPFKITVSEKDRKSMTYTIAVVDEGLLDITRFKTPNPWDKFFAKEALGVKTWDMYDDVINSKKFAFKGRMITIGGSDELSKENKKFEVTSERFLIIGKKRTVN